MDALSALRSLGLEGQTSGPGGEKLLQQAQHIWSMLDDMSASDPQAYSRFIEKQGKEYREMTAPPQPHMCVSTDTQGVPLYVNIMSWPRIPKPKSEQDNIPLYAGPLDNFKEKNGGTVSTIAMTTNPEVLAEYGLDAKDKEQQKDFVNLTLDYVQSLCGRHVQRNFKILPRSSLFKGDLEKAQKFFTDSLKKAMKKDKAEGEEKKTPVPDVDLPESMISRLANIATTETGTNKNEAKQSNGSFHKLADNPQIVLPEKGRGSRQPAKGSLIQELHSEDVGEKLEQPQYSLERSPAGDCLVLRVELPGVESVSQCLLDISEDDMKLEVEGMYSLTVDLPSRIIESAAKAKFSKKQSSLTLHMPLVDS